MIDTKTLDEMARKLADNLPSGLKQFQQEAEKNMRAGLQSMFSRLDLVTREEFDAQTKVLARTRSLVEALETRVAALESQLAAPKGPAKAKSKKDE